MFSPCLQSYQLREALRNHVLKKLDQIIRQGVQFKNVNFASPRNIFDKYGRASKSIRTILTEERSSQDLVNILGYALMPNHFHLLMQQKVDDGIKKFMHRLGTAYSMYFNKKNDRTGVLFQGRFKAKHIDNDPYFLHIFSYVHLNPLDLFQENWKQEGLKNKKEATKFLLEYPYASCGDYFAKEGEGRPERTILGSLEDNLWRDTVTTPAHLFTHLK
jgi:REP element-mobilizing transposase RayT